MAYAAASKAVEGDLMRVQLPPPAFNLPYRKALEESKSFLEVPRKMVF